MQKCPFPECDYIADIITNSHYKQHGIEKNKLFEMYGRPENLNIFTYKLNKNLPKTFSIFEEFQKGFSSHEIQKKMRTYYH